YNNVSYLVRIDSCKAQELVDAFGQVKDAAGLSGALGAKWWPVGVAGGVLFAWAWHNQNMVKNAAAAGTGVEFVMAHGIVVTAEPQD
ncbi:MAG: hypothetical protein ACRDXB_04395, partial [Actinomycetes bacterium]